MIKMGLLTKEEHLGKHPPLENLNTDDNSQIGEEIGKVEEVSDTE